MQIIFIFIIGVFSVSLTAQTYQPAELLNLRDFTQAIVFPGAAREAGISGKVLIRVWANADSSVTLDRIIKSPDTLFSQEVIQKLSYLRAKPASKEGQFVQEGITFPIQFNLQEESQSFKSQMDQLKWECRPSGLCYAWINQSGAAPLQKNKMAAMHYTGMLEDGKVFDTSKQGKGKPFLVLVGKSSLIAGWEEAFTFLGPGDRVWLRIPPDLGYGAQEIEGIPSNSTLFFDLEVLK